MWCSSHESSHQLCKSSSLCCWPQVVVLHNTPLVNTSGVLLGALTVHLLGLYGSPSHAFQKCVWTDAYPSIPTLLDCQEASVFRKVSRNIAQWLGFCSVT